MFGLSPTELAVILIIVLVLFGPRRLPELGSSIGKAISNFKNSYRDTDSGVAEAKKDSEKKEKEA